MNKRTVSGLLALGIASVAYWFKGMTPEQRQNVKDKVSGASKKFTDSVKSSVNSAKESIDSHTKAPTEI